MENHFSVYRFSLDSSQEVDSVLDSIDEVAKGRHLLIYVATYLYNTVKIQNFLHGLNKRFEACEIISLPAERHTDTEIIVFAYDEALNEDAHDVTLKDQLLFATQLKNETLSEKLSDAKHQLVSRYFHDDLTNLPNLYRLRQDLLDDSDFTFVIINIDNFYF